VRVSPSEKTIKDALKALKDENKNNKDFAEAQRFAEDSMEAMKLWQKAQHQFIKVKDDAGRKIMDQILSKYVCTKYATMPRALVKIPVPLKAAAEKQAG